MEEHEANEFAHYLLHKGSKKKISQYINRHKKATIVALSRIALFMIGCFVYGGIQRERSYYGEFSITSTGNKYHLRQTALFRRISNGELYRQNLSVMQNGNPRGGFS